MTREEIIAAVARETSSSGTDITNFCHDKLNWIQDDICSRHDFLWLKKNGYINTIPIYTTGTVTVTNNSATVIGLGTAFTSDMVGRLFFGDDGNNWYEISARVSPTEIRLASNYMGSTRAGIAYRIYKTDYALASDFKKLIFEKQLITPLNMISIPEKTFNQYYPDMFSRGAANPDAYMLTGIDANGLYTISFSPVQITGKQIYYKYIRELPTINTLGAISKIPTKWHAAIVFKLNVFVFNMIDLPNKAPIYDDLYERAITKMIVEDLKRDKSIGYAMAKERLGQGSNVFVKFDPTHFNNRS